MYVCAYISASICTPWASFLLIHTLRIRISLPPGAKKEGMPSKRYLNMCWRDVCTLRKPRDLRWQPFWRTHCKDGEINGEPTASGILCPEDPWARWEASCHTQATRIFVSTHVSRLSLILILLLIPIPCFCLCFASFFAKIEPQTKQQSLYLSRTPNSDSQTQTQTQTEPQQLNQKHTDTKKHRKQREEKRHRKINIKDTHVISSELAAKNNRNNNEFLQK